MKLLWSIDGKARAQKYEAVFTTGLFGYERIDAAVDKALAIWEGVTEQVQGQENLRVHFRNPYTLYQMNELSTRNRVISRELQLELEGSLDDFTTLMEHLREHRQIPRMHRGFRNYQVFGKVDLGIGNGEDVVVTLSPPKRKTFFEPRVVNANKLKGMVYHFVPPVEGYEPVFDLGKLVDGEVKRTF
jgi:hypothetical protein